NRSRNTAFSVSVAPLRPCMVCPFQCCSSITTSYRFGAQFTHCSSSSPTGDPSPDITKPAHTDKKRRLVFIARNRDSDCEHCDPLKHCTSPCLITVSLSSNSLVSPPTSWGINDRQLP